VLHEKLCIAKLPLHIRWPRLCAIIKMIFTCARQYSIPAPKGGRHAHNIILREDQKEYKDAVQRQQRFERALEKGLDIFSPEYMTQGSPFGVAGPHERAQVCACFARWLALPCRGVSSSSAAFAHRLGLGSAIRTKLSGRAIARRRAQAAGSSVSRIFINIPVGFSEQYIHVMLVCVEYVCKSETYSGSLCALTLVGAKCAATEKARLWAVMCPRNGEPVSLQ
jgi:hypothetical protein